MVITHSKASIEEMERSWNGDLEEVLRNLYSNEFVHECVVMKTCNRIEIYVVSPKGSSVQKVWLFPYRWSSSWTTTNHSYTCFGWLADWNP